MSVDLGILPTNGEAYLTPNQGLTALRGLLNEAITAVDAVSFRKTGNDVVAVINVENKPLYLRDTALFATPHDARMTLWDTNLKNQNQDQDDKNRRSYPLLGSLTPEDADAHTTSWSQILTQNSAPYLQDHVFDSASIFPATAYIEMFTRALLTTQGLVKPGDVVSMTAVKFLAPLSVSAGESRLVKTILDRNPRNDVAIGTLRIVSRKVQDQDQDQDTRGRKWTTHASCEVRDPNPLP